MTRDEFKSRLLLLEFKQSLPNYSVMWENKTVAVKILKYGKCHVDLLGRGWGEELDFEEGMEKLLWLMENDPS